jgi:hypothetical protein
MRDGSPGRHLSGLCSGGFQTPAFLLGGPCHALMQTPTPASRPVFVDRALAAGHLERFTGEGRATSVREHTCTRPPTQGMSLPAVAHRQSPPKTPPHDSAEGSSARQPAAALCTAPARAASGSSSCWPWPSQHTPQPPLQQGRTPVRLRSSRALTRLDKAQREATAAPCLKVRGALAGAHVKWGRAQGSPLRRTASARAKP